MTLVSEHAPVTMDLRQVCSADEDYVNCIEPSVVGGGKIARAIGAEMLEGATSGS